MSSLFNLDATAMGGCLTTAQRVGIKNALYRLQIHERLDDVQFWGKINGSEADYFIAVATTLNTSIHKHFYWRSAPATHPPSLSFPPPPFPPSPPHPLPLPPSPSCPPPSLSRFPLPPPPLCTQRR